MGAGKPLGCPGLLLCCLVLLGAFLCPISVAASLCSYRMPAFLFPRFFLILSFSVLRRTMDVDGDARIELSAWQDSCWLVIGAYFNEKGFGASERASKKNRKKKRKNVSQFRLSSSSGLVRQQLDSFNEFTDIRFFLLQRCSACLHSPSFFSLSSLRFSIQLIVKDTPPLEIEAASQYATPPPLFSCCLLFFLLIVLSAPAKIHGQRSVAAEQLED